LQGIGQTNLLKLIDARIKDGKANSTYIVMTDNDDKGKEAGDKLDAELTKRDILHIPYIKYIEYLQHYEAMRNMKDSNEMLVNRRGDFIDLIQWLYDEAIQITLAEYESKTASTYFTDFIERVTGKTYEPIPTQFTKLNNALSGRLH
jgi:5S rRNA maturation endonuclease (ribonuclease M5)